MEWWVLVLFIIVAIMAIFSAGTARGGLAGRLARVEAKLARVEAKLDLMLGNTGVPLHDPYANLDAKVAEAVQRGEKLEAIKHHRKSSGVGLEEAKAFIEDVMRRANIRS